MLTKAERAHLLVVADEYFPGKIAVDEYNRLIDDAIERHTQEQSAEGLLLNALLSASKIVDGKLPNLMATPEEVNHLKESILCPLH